jgi:2-succinyl-5-enolpyruvyl-6-hydroxy-3-cyclohexene-1-carboxylate synthase
VSGPVRPDALLTHWSRLLFGKLVAAGVNHAVISPGSRSTPFVWAALHTQGLTCHSAIDERSAGFYALGMARHTGQPALLLCTSGSAGAHYFPAVIEAAEARLPLLVLTADRPLELQDASAAQTIDQTRLFGQFARRFYELGQPDASPSALAGLCRLAEQAVFHSLHPEAGPVHLNARARKPLEPVSGDAELTARVDELLRAPSRLGAVPALHADDGAIARLAGECRETKRGLIVLGPSGPGPLPWLAPLLEATGFPVLCEATSQRRFDAHAQVPRDRLIDGFDPLLRAPDLVPRLSPELVLHFGPPTTSSALESLLSSGRVRVHVVARHGFPDPSNRAASVTLGDLDDAARRLTRALTAPPNDVHTAERADFAERWARANRAVWSAVERVAGRAEGLRESSAVRAVVERLQPGTLLTLGNSLPVRDVDQFVPAAERGIVVLSQRGANGIDGLLSGAAGAALVHSGPSALLVGDVSFLHDLGGLDLVRRAQKPLVVVVIDNAGGRIFDQLPVARHFEQNPAAREFWTTERSLDLVHAARLFGVAYAAPGDTGELSRELDAALSRPSATLIQVRVIPDSAALDLAAVVASVTAELAPEERRS